ncbi:MAG: NADH:flavin oxidoreductase [Deltaproteobacteria bacterium]|nr:NADH:flavin oxidoreductase [Deltaproteobacteria bacterium]
MNKIFTPLKINRMVLPNRFVRSATVDNLGQHGRVSEAQLDLYGALSEGEIGLIISGGIYPTLDGLGATGQLGAHTDDVIPGLRRLVDAVHKNNGKIAAQILHGGFRCQTEVSGFQPIGPSAMFYEETGLQVRELSSDEIYGLVESYAQAARRLIESGFDAVQLHGAHGWLLSAFLSPVMNKREDEWGGSSEARSRFVRLIYEGIRKMAGPDYPIMIKLGFKDYHMDGKPLSEGIETALMLESLGMDAIELSEGIEPKWGHHIRPNALEPYYKEECLRARQALSLPLILVGGMRRLRDMRGIIDDGFADAVSLCRPFINAPDIVRRFKEGTAEFSECTSCNECIERMLEGRFQCTLT